MLNITACRLCWKRMIYDTNLAHTEGNWENGVSFICPFGNNDNEHLAYSQTHPQHRRPPTLAEKQAVGWWYSLAERPPKGCPYFVEHIVSQTPDNGATV